MTAFDEFPEVFQGLGYLPGKYGISVDPFVPPVVHPRRQVPHSKRDPLGVLLWFALVFVVMKTSKDSSDKQKYFQPDYLLDRKDIWCTF